MHAQTDTQRQNTGIKFGQRPRRKVKFKRLEWEHISAHLEETGSIMTEVSFSTERRSIVSFIDILFIS